jgi:hypothetical protein
MPRIPFDPAVDYYQLLGVEPRASSEEIQAAYRRLAKAYHPDLNAGSSAAAARMSRVNAAKSVLLDAETRGIYDNLRALRRRIVGRVAAGATPAGPPQAPQPAQTSVRYSPQQSVTRPRYRVVSRGASQHVAGAAFDRQTGILLVIALPLLAALALYVFQAFQLSIQPLRAAPSDVALLPNNRPTARGTADAVFMMVHGQPMSRELATRANNLILSRTDSTPESELLRADGRRLIRSASAGDAESWDAAVLDLCQLAARC